MKNIFNIQEIGGWQLTYSILWYLLIVMGSIGCLFLIVLISAIISIHYSQNVREKLFKTINDLSINQIEKFSASSLVVRITNDISKIESTMGLILSIALVVPFKIVGAFIYPYIFPESNGVNEYKWQYYVILVCSSLLLVVIISIIVAIVHSPLKKAQKSTDDLNIISDEKISGTKVIRSFNSQQLHNNRFNKKNDELYKLTIFPQCLINFGFPFISLIFVGTTTLIYFFTGLIMHKTPDQNIYVMAISFTTLANLVLSAILQGMIAILNLPAGNISGKRILEVINTKPSIVDPKNTKDIKRNNKNIIEFKNVNFKYENTEENILSKVSFSLKKGEVMGIIGPIGSGKTHLINLIPRLIDVTDGEVLYHGINVKKYKLNDLRKNISYISQKIYFFNDTILNNIKNNDEKMKIKKIKSLAQICEADDFIELLPKKYDEVMNEQGNNFSGGQKQRISLLRGINKKSDLIIFDSTFSALDNTTDKNIRKSLKKNTKGVAKIIISQKISTIIDADKIIVLENGKITGIGKHEQLLKTNKFYKNIYKIQTRGSNE